MTATFDDDYVCMDCGKPWNSIAAMMHCPCDKYDRNGYEKNVR